MASATNTFSMPRPGEADESGRSGPVEAGETAGPTDVTALRAELGIDSVLGTLESELVGLQPVKQRIRDIASLLLVDKMRSRLGLATRRPNLHMCFMGPPGTGKTTVAVRMAEILHALGHLPTSRLVVVSREELVGQYVGHTAPKTKEVLQRAIGGVLFIDEAYSLHRPENERDYGQEAIEILLQVMEEERERLVVILAGYEDRMSEFFALNPGLRSRIAHHLEFAGFSLDELVEIGHRMLAEEGYKLAPEAEPTFRQYLELRRAQPHFASARSVRNAIERARLRQATRLVEGGGTVGQEELTTIVASDFLASRVFSPDETAP